MCAYCVFSGKGVGLGGLAGSQAVSFRQGTNVEFGNNTFNGNGAEALDVAYNLDNIGSAGGKSRDFSNPMYDVQNSGDPTLGNGSSGKSYSQLISSNKPLSFKHKHICLIITFGNVFFI